MKVLLKALTIKGIIIWCLLCLCAYPHQANAWSQIQVNAACSKTGTRCLATITDSSTSEGCCDPTSHDVESCIKNNECLGTYGYRWSSSNLPLSWSFNPNNMPGKAGFVNFDTKNMETALKTAWDAWTKPVCTSFLHKYAGISQIIPDMLDKKVVIYLPTEKEWAELGMGTGALAYSMPVANAQGQLSDGDIVFNPSVPWAIPRTNEKELDFTYAAAHEIGHTLGFGHSHDLNALMYPYMHASQPPFSEISPDERKAICQVYPHVDSCNTSSDCGICYQCQNASCQHINPTTNQLCKTCTAHTECGPNGVCVVEPQGRRCLLRCQQNCCPEGFECVSSAQNGYICIPSLGFCPVLPCTKDDDCKSNTAQCHPQTKTCIPKAPYDPQLCNRLCQTDAECGNPAYHCVEQSVNISRCATACSNDLLCPLGLKCYHNARGSYCLPPDPMFCPCQTDSDCLRQHRCLRNLCLPANKAKVFEPCNDHYQCEDGLDCIPRGTNQICVLRCDHRDCPAGQKCMKVLMGFSVCINVAADIGEPCDELIMCKDPLRCLQLNPSDKSGYCVESCVGHKSCSSGGICQLIGNDQLGYCTCGPDKSCGPGRLCRLVSDRQIPLCMCMQQPCKDQCNNQVCDSYHGENCSNCPNDCPCKPGETCRNGACSSIQTQCGDGVCEGEENCDTCSNDCACSPGYVCNQGLCRPTLAVCGDQKCQPEYGENCQSCPGDCPCPTGHTCQSGVCKPPPVICGDKICQPERGENCQFCPDDCPCPTGHICQDQACKLVPAICGDNICQSERGENCDTCPDDCQCPKKYVCMDGACIHASKAIKMPRCGDQSCDLNAGENCSNCPQDCGCNAQQICKYSVCLDANLICPTSNQQQICDDEGQNCQTICVNSGCACQHNNSMPSLPILLLCLALLILQFKIRTRIIRSKNSPHRSSP